jgi:malonate transporter
LLPLIALVLPVFLVISLGKFLQLTLVRTGDAWDSINKISYWVLFPAFLFFETSKLDTSNPNVLDYAFSLVAGFVAAMTFAYLSGRLVGADRPTLTSIIQGAGRHNTFIGLAVAGQLFGEFGSSIGIVATAALVPLSNVVVVIVLASMLNREAGVRNVIYEILRNPIILSIAAGLVFNAIDLDRDFILYQLTGLLGRATLPVLLLVIGANLRVGDLKTSAGPVIQSLLAKMVVFPITTYVLCRFTGLSTDMMVIALIFAMCPTSPASFPLARQLGGNAPLMATIISVQTAVSVIAIPIAIMLVQP